MKYENERLNNLHDIAMQTGKYAENFIDSVLQANDFSNKSNDDFLEYLELHHKFGEVRTMYTQDANILLTLEKRIHSITLSVTGMDLVYEASKVDDSLVHVTYFGNLTVSLICQFDTPWVQDCLKTCMLKWESNPKAYNYVKDYLTESGYDTTDLDGCVQAILANAPSLIVQDPAPDIWKAYYLLSEIYKDANPAFIQKANENVNKNAQAKQKYFQKYEDGLYDDMPDSIANQQAYEQMADENPGVFARAGAIMGKVVNMRYECAKNFNDAMRTNLGDNADAYFAMRDQHMRDRKMQRAQQQQSQFYQQMMQQRQNSSYYNDSYSNYYGYNQNGMYNQQQPYGYPNNPYGATPDQRRMFNDPRYTNEMNMQGRNFAPNIPMHILAIIIHVIIILLFWLFAKKVAAVFVSVGLMFASFGWLRKQLNEPNAMAFMIGGYIVALIAFIA